MFKKTRTSKQRLETKDRQLRALEMRKSGMTYRAIADVLKISHQATFELVDKALDEMNELAKEKAEQIREIELERLDMMLFGLWNNANSGDPQAVDRVLKIMDRRAAYLGLDKQQLNSGASTQHELKLTLIDDTNSDFEITSNINDPGTDTQ